MLASILPGLRDIRTPLATGCLWLLVLWLLLHDQVPMSVEAARGPVKSMYELAALAGTATSLTAVSFVAYLVGTLLSLPFAVPAASYLRLQTPDTAAPVDQSRTSRIGRFSPRSLIIAALLEWTRTGRRGPLLQNQLRTFVSTRVKEDMDALSSRDHNDLAGLVAHDFAHQADVIPSELSESDLTERYMGIVAVQLPEVAVQLQAKNRDFWDTYDRKEAEASFRSAVSLPIALLVVVVALQSSPWWLVLLVAPVGLFIGGQLVAMQAISILVQAVALKLVEPQIMEELRRIAEKNRQSRGLLSSVPNSEPSGTAKPETSH